MAIGGAGNRIRERQEQKVTTANQAAAAAAVPSTMPKIPTLMSGLTQDGVLGDNYKVGAPGAVTAGQMNINSLMADPRALNALRDRAMTEGPSPWLSMQLGQQRLNEVTAADGASAASNQAANTAMSNLAMNGGMSGGASERIATSSARDASLARNAISRQGQLDRMALSSQDEANKIGMLGQVAGLDLSSAAQMQDMNKFNISSALDANKFNVGNAFDADKFNKSQALGALDQENLNRLGVYGEQMKGYASGKTADAARNAGKK